MATIKIRKSTLANAKPPSLAIGELAINATDGALFYSNGTTIKNIIDNSLYTKLTGLTIGTGAVAATDTVLISIGKLQGQVNTLNTSVVTQDMVGSEPNQVPANQFLGRLAFQDNTGVQVVYRHTPNSKVGDIWREWISNTQTQLKRHCEDGYIRSLAVETWA